MSKLVEDDHLKAALAQAEAMVADAEEHHCSSQAAAWFSCVATLRRFLATPACVEYPHPIPDPTHLG